MVDNVAGSPPLSLLAAHSSFSLACCSGLSPNGVAVSSTSGSASSGTRTATSPCSTVGLAGASFGSEPAGAGHHALRTPDLPDAQRQHQSHTNAKRTLLLTDRGDDGSNPVPTPGSQRRRLSHADGS